MHGTDTSDNVKMLYLDIKTVTGGSNLVGGFSTNPFEKYARQNLDHFQKIEVKIPKNIGNHHLVHVL